VAGVPPDFELRQELEKLSTPELFEKLRELDPERAEVIDSKNPRRLVRAIEVVAHGTCPAPNGAGGARPDRKREVNVSRGALVDEVYDLLERGYRETPAMKGIVYRTALDFVDQKITKAEMLKKIQFDLHGYIRRQLTWFRRDKAIRWFDITEPGFDKQVVGALRSKL